MIKFITFFLFTLSSYASEISKAIVETQVNESFITKFEYGKMLYNNPRGISCAKCHGADAKGMVLSKFKHYEKKNTYYCEIKTDDITRVSLDVFKAKLDPEIKEKRPKFGEGEVCAKMIYGNTMPKYFLTQNELESIYYYITQLNKK
jgi:hypothetical protein